MFFRIKPSGDRRYLQIVENTRDGRRTSQRVLATLGRIEDLEADGKLDTLLRSGARFSETAMLISSGEAATLESSASMRIGAALLFGRLWEQSGCRRVIEQLAQRRGFGFSLERAVFVSVLHRLMVSGSDRACEKWLDAYLIDGADGLELHQLYRAMAWLGEELADQTGATRAPRRTKDVIEEKLFARRRSLFSDLSVVLFDTTSLMFYGAGGETLGQRGKSKDHRPDLRQVIVGVVLDEAGRPICSETWPGNATDVKALLPVVSRLRERFGIARMCVVADRGMISAETMTELEALGLEYILGARERSDSEVREVVLADDRPMVPLVVKRARGSETALEVKEVVVGDWGPGCKPRRYVVCFNPEEAKRDAAAREVILDSLRGKLQEGTSNWSAMPVIAGSWQPRARDTSRSIPPASPRMPASTGSMCCAPTASYHSSRLPWRTGSCGEWRRSSERQNPFSRPGRSIINQMLPSPDTCSARFSPCCCARTSMNGWLRLASPPNGRISFATSIASSRSPSSRAPSAMCSDPRRPAVPAVCFRLSVSPCRHCSVSCQPRPRHPTRRQCHPRSAAAGRGVVPRRLEFSRFSLLFSDFEIPAVQLQQYRTQKSRFKNAL